MPKNDNLVVGLDIGTSKVMVIVAQVDEDGCIEVIGTGHAPANGMRKGVVSNIESTVHSIKRAVEDAELTANCRIFSVSAGVAGAHISSINSHGVVAIRGHEVTENDIERVIDAAQAMAIPQDQQILHVLPQDYIIDAQDGIKEPVGMYGVRMEAHVHMITGGDSAIKNIKKCIRLCGLEVDDLILEQLASSTAVLSENELDLGVYLVDIGGGTTDIAVFNNGAICHTAVIPVAGDQITNDIATVFHTPTSAAETIKKEHGCALAQLVPPGKNIETPSMGERPPRVLSRISLAQVIEPRLEELFLLVKDEIKKSGYDEGIGSGIVLTGGSSRMRGIIELAEEVFHLPVRQGLPTYDGNLCEAVCDPIYATGVGLVQFGHANRHHRVSPMKVPTTLPAAWQRVKNWFTGSF